MVNPFSRRTLLALLGIGPMVSASSGRSAAEDAALRGAAARGGGGERKTPTGRVATRVELNTHMPEPGESWFVDDGPRAGSWTWRAGDFTAAVAADPLQGLTMRHPGRPASAGAWRRDWDGQRGHAEWFGAEADKPDVDCRAALQAAVDLCPTVALGPGAYHVSGRVQILKSGTRLVGCGITQTDQGANVSSTQIVCTDAAATILQIGSDSARQPSPLVETVQLADFTVRRAVDPMTPDKGYESAIGIAMRWCVNCHIERVFSIDSGRGWHFFGTIENYVRYCASMRGRRGTSRSNDSFIGFHLDYTAPLAANGGNASLYFDHCRSFAGFGEGRPDLAYSAGLRTDGGWVDLYINAFEVGLIQYGIDGHGDAYDGGKSYKTEDLIITNCVLDPGEIACIRLQTADTTSAVQIAGCYLATSTGGASVLLKDLGGSISLTANQLIVGAPGASGIVATSVNNLRAAGNIHTRIRQPFRLEHVMSFDLADSIHGLDTGNDAPAVALIGCERGKIDCIVNGPGGCYSAGVGFEGAPSRLVEVACTNLQASALPGGKVRMASGAVTAIGPFGDNCLAQGLMV